MDGLLRYIRQRSFDWLESRLWSYLVEKIESHNKIRYQLLIKI